MIEAVVRRKLGSCERSEDLLTSTAFGLLRYLPHDYGVIALLRQTRHAYLEGEKLVVESDDARNEQWLGIQTAVRCEFEFWPWWGPHGQPDLLLSLFDESDRLVHLAAVEVKLDAHKGGSAGENDSEPVGDERDADQLAKYWQGLNAIFPAVERDRKTVVYLTSHVIPPVDELAGSLGCESDMRLGLLSWRQLLRVMERLCRSSLNLFPTEDLAPPQVSSRGSGTPPQASRVSGIPGHSM